MRTSLSLLLLLIAFVAAAQKGRAVYKSVYQINGVDLSLSLPDTLTKSLGIEEKVKLPVGTIRYFNTCNGTLSQTRIAFITNPGFQGVNASEHVVYTNAKARTYSEYKTGEFVKCLNYKLPSLSPAGDSAMVNGYNAKPYRYIGKDSLNATVWFAKALPVEVNPGLTFKGYGGVAKIEYELNGQRWSLDLVSTGRMEDGIVKDETIRKPTSKVAAPHFLFNRNEE